MSGRPEPQVAALVPRLYTTKETCEILSLRRPQLQAFVNKQWIVPIREGRWVRYSQMEIDRFVVNMQRRAAHLEPLSMVEFLAGQGVAS